MDELDLDVKGESARPHRDTQAIEHQGPDADGALWAEFAEATTAESFCRSWLAIQCRRIGGVRGGLVLIGPPGRGPFTPAAVWPSAKRSLKYLTPTAEQALKESRGLLLKREPNGEPGAPSRLRFDIAYPIQMESKLCGVVVDLTICKRSNWKAKLSGL